jgi:hypothetical protein
LHLTRSIRAERLKRAGARHWTSSLREKSCHPAPALVAVGEARLLDHLPPPGQFIRICIKHRKQFKRWKRDVLTLLAVRDRVHDKLGSAEHDGEDGLPF